MLTRIRNKMSCIDLSFIIRVIATHSLVVYSLVLLELAGSCFNPDYILKIITILGLDFDVFFNYDSHHLINSTNSNKEKLTLEAFESLNHHEVNASERNHLMLESPAKWVLVALLLFSAFQLIASLLLIWASFSNRSWAAVPWIIGSGLSVLSQLTHISRYFVYPQLAPQTHIWVGSLLVTIVNILLWYLVIWGHHVWANSSNASPILPVLQVQGRNNAAWDNIFQSPPSYHTPCHSPYRQQISN